MIACQRRDPDFDRHGSRYILVTQNIFKMIGLCLNRF